MPDFSDFSLLFVDLEHAGIWVEGSEGREEGVRSKNPGKKSVTFGGQGEELSVVAAIIS